MRTVAISGAASGIGAATRRRLERDGVRVLGCDLREGEVVADLAVADERERAVAELSRAADGRLDGLVVCAGLGPHVEPAAQIASVNFFAAAALLEGLRPALARGAEPAAVAISSNSISITPDLQGPFLDACLAGEEARARELAGELPSVTVYAAAKLALAHFVRRRAPSAEWGGAGIRLNAVAPGATLTPLLQAGLDRPGLGESIRALPIPLGGEPGRPEQIAEAIAFLLSPAASFCCGSLLFVDGGSDALIRGGGF